MIVASIFAPREGENRWNCDYDDLLMLLDESCDRFSLKHVVISDCVRPEPLETRIYDLPQNLMQVLLDGQRQLLEDSDEAVLLVGADCLIGYDPRQFFLQDLTITVDDSFSDCRMNTGAIFCSNGKKCAPIWAEALKANPREWGEDQVALYNAVCASGLGVREIQCERHNRAPENKDDGRLSTVVHFRGRRKEYMRAWAKRFMDIG